MDISLFDYNLPMDRIAQFPTENRGDSRMMVLSPKSESISHRLFRDLPEFIQKGDVLVINRTRVIKARLIGKKAKTGAAVEVFLLKEIEKNLWECLVRPGNRLHAGARIEFTNSIGCEIVDRTEYGGRIARFDIGVNVMDILNEIGHVPLPPYIKREDNKDFDEQRYQTVYADIKGSVAAPTAGLHFTSEMLVVLEEKGIQIAPLILHVGLGTFQPVKEQTIEEHKMHTESYSLPPETAQIINNAKNKGQRVLAVGTTAVRALETCSNDAGSVSAGSGETDLFIYPGYKFRILRNLLTNFHLPRSTLLMMISALAGREFILRAYEEAINNGYRFYSYGDCMLILNE